MADEIDTGGLNLGVDFFSDNVKTSSEASPNDLWNLDVGSEKETEKADDDDDGNRDTKEEGEEEGERDAETEEGDEGEDEETEEGSEEDEETEKEVEKKQDYTRKKPFVVKDADGNKTKLAPSSVLSLKVDGKTQDISLTDLVDGYSSKSENLKKFNEVQSKEREVLAREAKIGKELTKELNNYKEIHAQYNARLQEFAQAIEGGRAVQALSIMFESVGKEPLPIIRALRNEIIDRAKEYLDLSPEERKLRDIYEENEYLKDKERKAAIARSKVDERNQFSSRIAQVISETGIPSRDVFDEIEQNMKSRSGGRNVTPEEVGTYFVHYQKARFAAEAIKEVDIDLLQNQVLIDKCLKLVDAFSPTKQELIDAIKTFRSEDETSSKKEQSKKPSSSVKTVKPSQRQKYTSKGDAFI